MSCLQVTNLKPDCFPCCWFVVDSSKYRLNGERCLHKDQPKVLTQLANNPGTIKSLSPAKVSDWQKDSSTAQKRLFLSQENQQLKAVWTPVVCHKIAAPEGSEERVAGQEGARATPEETLSTTFRQSLVITEISPEGPDRPHAGQEQSREAPEQSTVVPGLSNLVPEISLTNTEESLVFPEPSHAGQEQSRTLPEQSLILPELTFTNPEQSLFHPEGPEQSSANPDRSQIPKGEPVMPFHPTSPAHQWTWITSVSQPNLSMPKSTLAPQLFPEAASSQSVPVYTLAPQLYAKTTPAQPQAPLSAGRTGTQKSAGSVKS